MKIPGPMYLPTMKLIVYLFVFFLLAVFVVAPRGKQGKKLRFTPTKQNQDMPKPKKGDTLLYNIERQYGVKFSPKVHDRDRKLQRDRRV